MLDILRVVVCWQAHMRVSDTVSLLGLSESTVKHIRKKLRMVIEDWTERNPIIFDQLSILEIDEG